MHYEHMLYDLFCGGPYRHRAFREAHDKKYAFNHRQTIEDIDHVRPVNAQLGPSQFWTIRSNKRLRQYPNTRLAVVGSSPWDGGEEGLKNEVMQPERCGCAKSAMRSSLVLVYVNLAVVYHHYHNGTWRSYILTPEETVPHLTKLFDSTGRRKPMFGEIQYTPYSAATVEDRTICTAIWHPGRPQIFFRPCRVFPMVLISYSSTPRAKMEEPAGYILQSADDEKHRP
ncbi:hypothetical protein M405DRAFT_838545 [Rhizopogon salebrosus TDB-379]|nr:hypothetical protein M405DRAFT_838545 [Rhizopogon salebrosus TDB-379]